MVSQVDYNRKKASLSGERILEFLRDDRHGGVGETINIHLKSKFFCISGPLTRLSWLCFCWECFITFMLCLSVEMPDTVKFVVPYLVNFNGRSLDKATLVI